jgi:hypothetical protein
VDIEKLSNVLLAVVTVEGITLEILENIGKFSSDAILLFFFAGAINGFGDEVAKTSNASFLKDSGNRGDKG